MEATLAFPMLFPFMRVAQRHGAAATALQAQATELLTGAGVFEAALPLTEIRVPHSVASELLELAIELTGDAALALHAGACVELGDFGTFEYLLRSCATLGEALEVGAQHIAILHDGAEVDVVSMGDNILWRHHLEDPYDTSPGVHEYVMASFMTATRRIVNSEVSPLAVHFIHREPAYRSEYEQLFRAPCYFGADYNAFLIAGRAAELPLPTADAALFRLMKQHAREILKQLPRRQPFRARVRDAIAAELAASGASLKSVARRLDLTPGTLRRRLTQHGTTHSEMVDLVKRERVRELLARSEDSLETIALATGFSHATALHRAFRRWFGMTPEQFRRDL
jgi:AraC-like DNA-binding protein